MKTKHFSWLMAALVAILIACALFGKMSCNEQEPEKPIVATDSIVSYYKPLLHIMHAQRYRDSLDKVKTNSEIDSLKEVIKKRKQRISVSKDSLESAEVARDTPAIVQKQKKLIQEQDSIIYDQDQQLTKQGQNIERQEREIQSYATELELYKGIAQQVSDENVVVKNQNIQLTQQNKNLTKKVERKNGVIKVLVGSVVIESVIILITTL